MTKEEFYKLGFGDVIKFHGRGSSYVVVSNDGEKIRAVSVMEATHPRNWDVVAKAEYPLDFIDAEKLKGL
jgi:ribosomal protein S4E